MRNKKACLFIFSLSDVMIGRCRRLSDGISNMVFEIIKSQNHQIITSLNLPGFPGTCTLPVLRNSVK